MAAVAITPSEVVLPADAAALAAVDESAALAVADHWEIPNNGRTYLMLEASAATAFTVRTTRQVLGLDVADLGYTIAAGDRSSLIGPFQVDIFGAELRIDTDVAGAQVSVFRL